MAQNVCFLRRLLELTKKMCLLVCLCVAASGCRQNPYVMFCAGDCLVYEGHRQEREAANQLLPKQRALPRSTQTPVR